MAAAFTSVSKATGTPSSTPTTPATSVFAQPGLGVVVIDPRRATEPQVDGAEAADPDRPDRALTPEERERAADRLVGRRGRARLGGDQVVRPVPDRAEPLRPASLDRSDRRHAV